MQNLDDLLVNFPAGFRARIGLNETSLTRALARGEFTEAERIIEEATDIEFLNDGALSATPLNMVLTGRSSYFHQSRNLKLAHLLMQRGQFVDHDIILTPEGELNCCLESLRDDPLCANIEISRVDLAEDHIYRESRDRGWRQRCLKFTRSDNLCTTQAQDGSRTPLNALPSFLAPSAPSGGTAVVVAAVVGVAECSMAAGGMATAAWRATVWIGSVKRCAKMPLSLLSWLVLVHATMI